MLIHSHKVETLKHASQLAQNIETSLRFSSEHRFIPTAEQPRSNTHATRDPKDKSTIGESSKNVKGSQYLSVKIMITLLHSVPLEIF